MRVAVFRAADDGRRTAARLAGQGHQPVLAPVIRIVPTGAPIRLDDGDALIFTSARAPETLAARQGDTPHLHALPCWCVGTRTADAARTAGFRDVRTGAGTAAALAAEIIAAGQASRLLLVTGRDRKPDLERGLARAGIAVRVAEVYAAEAVTAWTTETVAGLATIAVALHYSRRTAALAQGLAGAAGLSRHFEGWRHICLSDDVAVGLSLADKRNIRIAERPDEASLLTRLAAAR